MHEIEKSRLNLFSDDLFVSSFPLKRAHHHHEICAAHERGHHSGRDFVREHYLPAQSVGRHHNRCTDECGGGKLLFGQACAEHTGQMRRKQSDEAQGADKQGG